MKREIKSLDDLKDLGREVARDLVSGDFILLSGPLGAGKTTLVGFIADALGSSSNVSSPTYVLENIYEGGRVPIRHWDLYRVKSPPQEIFEDREGTITLVEWGEKFEEVTQAATLSITIEICKIASERIITVKKWP